MGFEKVVDKAFHVLFFQTHCLAELPLGNRTQVKWSKYAFTISFHRTTGRWLLDENSDSDK